MSTIISPAQTQSGHIHRLSDRLTVASLREFDQRFLSFLANTDAQRYAQMQAYRQAPHSQPNSDFLIALAEHIEVFVADYFGITGQVQQLTGAWLKQDPILHFKEWFVVKAAKRKMREIDDLPCFSEVHTWLCEALDIADFATCTDPELMVAQQALLWWQDPVHAAASIEKLVVWCCYGLTQPQINPYVKNWISFMLPAKIVDDQLISVTKTGSRLTTPTNAYKPRDGFALTEQGKPQELMRSDVHHCIYCHDKAGDFCSKGFPEKKKDPSQGFRKNGLGNILTGCPLEQKISEMNVLKKRGRVIAPLAMIMRDNPMCVLTGHRICNDCQKACIYQKQEPVDVPHIESQILQDVLALPWGVEIYDLFTRWNPLVQQDYIMKPHNGYRVLVMGMGPAGITLAHYLLYHGCAVVGADGLPIASLPATLLHAPIKQFTDISTALDERIITGFGGVAEYGITARWNKNYLQLAYLSLARKAYFSVIGGVRFGGTLTLNDAWQLGFDHVAIAVGAGLPKELPIPGSLAKGMRAANDFLMALHLTGAVRRDNIASLEVELPALVIGGGLTGVDAATELQALYIQQVERVLARYEAIVERRGLGAVQARFRGVSAERLAIMLAHGKAVRAARQAATKAGKPVDFIPLLHKWGGVTIVYRKSMQASPAYRNNHHELQQALREGVLYAEYCEPISVLVDAKQHVAGLRVRYTDQDVHEETLPAKNILVATGAKPNVAYAFEHANDIERIGFQYKLYKADAENTLVPGTSAEHCKDHDGSFFSSVCHDKRRVSVIGDTHPAFSGSVVKAMASAKQSYQTILHSMQQLTPKGATNMADYHHFMLQIDLARRAMVQSIAVVGPMQKVTIYAPFALRNYEVGHFFRIQNLDTGNRHLSIEPISVFPASVAADKQSFTTYIEKDALVSRTWESNTPLIVMGPTGVKTRVKPYHARTTLFIDAQHIGPGTLMAEMIQQAGYSVDIVLVLQSAEELYGYSGLQAVADRLHILCAHGPLSSTIPMIAGDVEALYANPASEINRRLAKTTAINIKGSAQLIHAVKTQCFGPGAPAYKERPHATAMVAGPMQCMLKGVCAQCLQWQIDPETGQRTKAVYACSWQEQPIEIIAIDHMAIRHDSSHHVLQPLNRLWLDDGV